MTVKTGGVAVSCRCRVAVLTWQNNEDGPIRGFHRQTGLRAAKALQPS